MDYHRYRSREHCERALRDIRLRPPTYITASAKGWSNISRAVRRNLCACGRPITRIAAEECRNPAIPPQGGRGRLAAAMGGCDKTTRAQGVGGGRRAVQSWRLRFAARLDFPTGCERQPERIHWKTTQTVFACLSSVVLRRIHYKEGQRYPIPRDDVWYFVFLDHLTSHFPIDPLSIWKPKMLTAPSHRHRRKTLGH